MPYIDQTSISERCQKANELRHRNELDVALQVAEQALNEAKKSGNAELLGKCLIILADVHHDREDSSQAEILYRQASETFQQIGNEQGQGEAQLGLGIVELTRGDLERSKQFLLNASELAQRVGDSYLEGATYVNLGSLHAQRGRLQEAWAYHKRAIRIFESLGSEWGIAIQYTNLALIYARLGEIEKALACHERALSIDLELGNERGVTTDYGHLGDVYYELGDLDKAEEYYKRCLEYARKVGYQEQEGKAHNGLALVAVNRDDLTAARNRYAAALQALQAIGFRQGEAGAHVDFGYTLALCGDVEDGLHHCWEGLDIYQGLGHTEGEIAAHLCLGYVFLILLDDPQQAIAHYTDARDMATKLQQPDLTWRVYFTLGSSYYRTGQLDRAYEAYQKAVETIESIWFGLWREESRLGFIGSKSRLYTAIVMLCIVRWATGEDSGLIEAFEYLERGKSRAFLSLLGQTAIAVPRDVDPTSMKREAKLVEQIRMLTRALAIASGERQLILLQQVSDLRKTLDTLLDDIAQVAPEYTDLRRSEPLTYAKLQACLAST